MCCSGGGGNFPSPDEIGQAGARYNRIDQYTPWGSLTYSGPDRSVATQQLPPEMLALQNQMMGLRGGALAQLLARFGGTPTNIQNQSAPPTNWTVQGAQDPKDPFYQDPEDPNSPVYPWEDGSKVGTLTGMMAPLDASGRVAPIDGQSVPIDGQTSPIPGYVPGYDGENGYATSAYGDIGLPYDLGIDSMPSYEEDRKRYEQAYMDRARGLLDPIFQDKQASLDQQMANRGMPIGIPRLAIC